MFDDLSERKKKTEELRNRVNLQREVTHTMEETFVPFEGIKNDLKGRLMCYKQDWTGGIKAGFRY